MHKTRPAECRLLSSDGWNTCVASRLLRSGERWQDGPEFESHGHTLRRLFTDLKIDAVLCVDGRPTVCISDTRTMGPHQVEELRRKLWNLGATVLLMAEGAHDIKVFSTLAKPAQDDAHGEKAQLSSETIRELEAINLAMQLGNFIRRVETGEIYREQKSLFDPEQAIDRNLLNNLRSVRDALLTDRTLTDYRRVHALIGRFLFSTYLLDRGIIGPPYLKNAGLPEAEGMAKYLMATEAEPDALQRLFLALQRDFNGSLFGDILKGLEITAEHVAYLRHFLAGDNLRTGQLSLFKLYDFGFIPVELISCIYEDFLGAEGNAEEASPSSSAPQRTSQRTQGAYYTPPRLAELAVDIATEGWTTMLDKRCVDPACGSGVFLVILFTRMAEEWRKRNPSADTRRRYDGLMRLLSYNLQGIDTNPTACLVACFSLYLAFLEQMDPKEITELREVLNRDGSRKILPRILWKAGDQSPKTPHCSTIRESDFFEVKPGTEFDLILGNPPWVSHGPRGSAHKWLVSDSNPHLEKIPKSQRDSILFPARELATAFMWKGGLHIKPGGRVCQLLPSRVFLSNNTDRFQAEWLRRHRLEAVWLLADWRFILFPAASCPCIIARYHPRCDNEELGNFDFVTPKVESLDPREGLIPVFPEDQKTLSELEIVSAAKANAAAAVWKKYHWGTPRDARLIDRLMRMPRINRLASSPPTGVRAAAERPKWRWYKGQGFKPATASTKLPLPVFWKKTDLFLSAKTPVSNLILLKTDCRRIGDTYCEGLDRKRNPGVFHAPLLLINKACTKFIFSDFDVLFQDDFQSICAPRGEEDELLFLTAVLSSPLTQYLLFHTSANIGIERDIVRLEEILALPFPLPEDTADPARSDEIMRHCAQQLRHLRGELEKPENMLSRAELVQGTQTRLNTLVYKYFEICDWERQLIDDTVKIFRPSSTPGSLRSEKLLTVKESTRANRKDYAATLLKTFQGWTRTKKHLWEKCTMASRAGLAIITFGVGGREEQYSESEADIKVRDLLKQIANSTKQALTGAQILRGFAYYEPDRVHLLKPLGLRHWTHTAALNDADEILAQMMEEDGWGG